MVFERREIDNIVRVSSNKEIAKYCESVLMRASPRIYKKYGCIRIRFAKNMKQDVMYLTNLLWHVGIVVIKDDGVSKVEDAISTGRGNYIKEMYEVKLKKIGAIDFADESDYKDWMESMRKQWEKIK